MSAIDFTLFIATLLSHFYSLVHCFPAEKELVQAKMGITVKEEAQNVAKISR